MNSLVGNLLNALTKLKLEPNPNSMVRRYQCEQVFEAIFDIYSEKANIKNDERELIGNLVAEVSSHLDDCLDHYSTSFDPDLGRRNLLMRSGIQFMMDNFKQYPVKSGKGLLGESLERFNEYIESWDEAFARWRDDPAMCLESVSHTPAELARPPGIPQSHVWWS